MTPENVAVHEMYRQLQADMNEKGEATTPADFKRVYEEFLAKFEVPTDATFEEVEANGVPAIWCSAPGVAMDRAIIHYHSGGYVTGSANGYRQFGARLSAVSGVRVLLPDYRLAPDHPFPTPVDDGIAAYRWIEGQLGAENIVVSGDSSGGGLVMVLLQTLRDEGAELPVGGVCMSPFTDLAGSGESVQGNAGKDPLVNPDFVAGISAMYLGDSGASPEDPKASPLYGDFSGLPPLMIFASDTECFRDDAYRCAKKAQDAGVDVTYFEGKDMCHIWPIFADRLPEARKTLERVGQFVDSRFMAARHP
jgi:monoterpene epsilon-lactone hydrolase